MKKSKKKYKLEEFKLEPRSKLAALWTSFMFLYIYVDYFHLYMPNSLKNMIGGKVFTFEITQTFLLISLISVMIPALMIFLSTLLPVVLNRWVNIILGLLYIPYTLFNLVGEAWAHMALGAFAEVVLLGIIVLTAWRWPRTET